jgi:hypothetical protein
MAWMATWAFLGTHRYLPFIKKPRLNRMHIWKGDDKDAAVDANIITCHHGISYNPLPSPRRVDGYSRVPGEAVAKA